MNAALGKADMRGTSGCRRAGIPPRSSAATTASTRAEPERRQGEAGGNQ